MFKTEASPVTGRLASQESAHRHLAQGHSTQTLRMGDWEIADREIAGKEIQEGSFEHSNYTNEEKSCWTKML